MFNGAVCFAAVAALLLVGPASVAGFDSTNFTWHGFEMLSNVSGHLYMSKDACDIKTILLDAPKPVNFTAANAIFYSGKNSVRPDGKMTRKLSSWTAGEHSTGHYYYTNGTALFNNDSSWIASFWNASVAPAAANPAGRAVMAVHTARLQVPLNYMLAELEAIEEEINPNGTSRNPTSGVFEGAVHALDEAFGVYAGIASECAPWSYAEAGAGAFGTRASCNMSKANTALIQNLNKAQAAAIAGNVPSYVAARAEVLRQLQVSLIQSILSSSDAAERAVMKSARAAKAAAAAVAAAAAAADALAAAQAETYTLTRALAPMVHQLNPAAAKRLMKLVDPNVPMDDDMIEDALKELYAPMGITASMIGTAGAKDRCKTKVML